MSLMLVISLGYFYLFQKNNSLKFGNWYLIIAVLLGALATTFVSLTLNFGTVIGASTIGLLGSFIPKNFFGKNEGKQLRTAIYCGTFIGMCQPLAENHYLLICFASFLGGIVYCLSLQNLNGFGGKLGTIAFTGVCLAIFSLYIFVF
ncbi:hypothetical protein ACFFGL_14370 [Mesonia maritima]